MMRFLMPACALAALIAGSPAARAADSDFNGRWDLEVHKTPADKAWWLEITGAGTPHLKGRFVGFPGGSLGGYHRSEALVDTTDLRRTISTTPCACSMAYSRVK